MGDEVFGYPAVRPDSARRRNAASTAWMVESGVLVPAVIPTVSAAENHSSRRSPAVAT